ncbi:transducin family protein / WD-40 repeat family protein [Artemisia annua]|uniref:Transducin family protein / WD-40 repeat family protein n=1 Tax=Artemisia annua TaxID=35608 RepID=A0A2U1QEN6_ARTAN|nr:transducin family protein / WD-40 repeat family protein [Artemisia annua]
MNSGQYIGEISALCFLHQSQPATSPPLLLAGTGSELLFYDLTNSQMIASFQVFNGIRVHGITLLTSSNSSRAYTVAVFGERKLKLFKFDIELPLVSLVSVESLPSFGHWILDVCFVKDCASEASRFLAVGCTDNSVYFWDTVESRISYEVRSPDKCLLYTMRMWGDKIDSLHVASGTIFNEIIVWKVVRGDIASFLGSSAKDSEIDVCDRPYQAVPVCRLAGHEGSIFRITWSLDGSKLVSVSDDRSARIWEVGTGQRDLADGAEVTVSRSSGPVLFGHSARVWDCCMSDSVIVTVGEDCTCRVWGLDGTQLKVIKEHIGRGVWRCLYDPVSHLLVTAGFDSAIKVHQLHSSLSMGSEGCNGVEDPDKKQTFALEIPNSKRTALMDSKSEYVRCMHFASEDTLYVATNNGVLYLAKISDTGDVVWTQIFRASEDIPIVCMSVFPGGTSCVDNWISLGDGKGRLTVVRVADITTPEDNCFYTWPAEAERQLLETFWCASLGPTYVFTADPRGRLKLWNIQSTSEKETRLTNALLVAEFTSCFPKRIICLDASFQEEVLVCGDLRGNLILFPLLRDLLLGESVASASQIAPINYFKGAHGISSVSSVSIYGSSSSNVELHSTGGDGCICYMEYDKIEQKLEFVGMKQIKELSLVQSFYPIDNPDYAIGFASANYILWNLLTETKVAEIPCGGWRRPHTYFLGDVPEIKNCFAFVKDEVIYVHKYWVQTTDRIYPQNLHLQFHGREMHSLCFINNHTNFSTHETQSGFIATGCEDGTVRLTRYSSGTDNWSASKLLGEHVGGSAVRSLCSVFKVHTLKDDMDTKKHGIPIDDQENQFLLISVGAKRVLTAWKRKISSMSFQWLSSDFPTRNSGTNLKESKKEKTNGNIDNGSVDSLTQEKNELCCTDSLENDWRYMAVTAFLVKLSGSRTSVCFIVVACSDATVTLRALVLPHRLWFDIALLVPSASPVLSLQHIVVPELQSSKDKSQTRNLFIVISGSTDGSIGFWDVTEKVETFMQNLSVLCQKDSSNFQKRPRTGRGSQGGRRWRSLDKPAATSETTDSDHMQEQTSSNLSSSQEIDMIQPLHVLKNAHQSGVNCLHVSDARNTESCFSCYVVSGGDDQALHGFCFYVTSSDNPTSEQYQIVFSHSDKIASAHSSAVKGVWTDGHWVFSTGLDQRVRCWRVSVDGKLSEHAHLVVSVPEPEALDVSVRGRNMYQVAVAGRGMQMTEFSAPTDA